MNPFQELVEWLEEQGFAVVVVETRNGWKLKHEGLMVRWTPDDDFSLFITNDDRGVVRSLSLGEVEDEVAGWFF
jgi:hypothetical protein